VRFDLAARATIAAAIAREANATRGTRWFNRIPLCRCEVMRAARGKYTASVNIEAAAAVH